jgi:hypothetical protein
MPPGPGDGPTGRMGALPGRAGGTAPGRTPGISDGRMVTPDWPGGIPDGCAA